MSSPRRRVLITGATGQVGTDLADRLDDDYDVVRHGRTPPDDAPDTPVELADIADYDAVRPVLEGIDTVVHLAGAASPESSWDAVLQANIIGFRNVIEAAREAKVRRFVHASSNHAMGMYDRHREWPVAAGQLPRADSLYGVSKVFGESMGRYYHDAYGIDFIALRIGWVAPDPMVTDVELLHAMWLSLDDTEQVVRCAIEADVAHGVYYAVSANPNRRWDITNTMVELGYRPKDAWTDRTTTAETVVPGGAPSPSDWPAGS
ncbi:NAD-dependent epimerase/dehydratase family protein [Microlunatus sp. Y2014]|uniref:NAD-dependent epimerase/dehydratase family protein n=1 Tax=Microlunatus sp. Y2014 TaxID=3418488 RepID=UPI003DA77B96